MPESTPNNEMCGLCGGSAGDLLPVYLQGHRDVQYLPTLPSAYRWGALTTSQRSSLHYKFVFNVLVVFNTTVCLCLQFIVKYKQLSFCRASFCRILSIRQSLICLLRCRMQVFVLSPSQVHLALSFVFICFLLIWFSSLVMSSSTNMLDSLYEAAIHVIGRGETMQGGLK